ncbi:phospho-N-acetylmuramoyl-pentapeptide-transferase [candidate division WOR-3 bacterium]|nr:phospho-N-acetylmuramoyl-pentapeptide-transferase [candidate division WOR-3 bacterium]
MFKLLFQFRESFSVLNILGYITFRSAYAVITSLVISFFAGPIVIRKLKKYKTGMTVREFTPEGHEKKIGTPSMGGILMIVSIIISVLIWGDLTNRNVIILLSSLLWLGLFGFLDDLMKMKRKKGMRGKYKLAGQILLAGFVGLVLFKFPSHGELKVTQTNALFLKNLVVDFGWFYIPLILTVILGASNSVNITDGLDGLAAGSLATAFASFSVVAYIVGNIKASQYLHIGFDPSAAELTVFGAAAFGACLGFLWFNAHPAQVFMGDTGSLSLGGALGLMAVLLKQEILLVFVGGVFVLEALSVIMQVSYFKITGGKRIFKMTPIHHHFEKCGWSESKIVVRFWLLAILFALIGISTLKIR